VSATHLEFLVEEPSMEAFLCGLLPKVLAADTTFQVYPFNGKSDLLNKLPDRLKGYAPWLPEDWRIVVVVDRDDDDCRALKKTVDRMAERAGLVLRACGSARRWQVVNRIAIEELEAWYFGDWEAVRRVFPRVAATVPLQAAYRNPDGIAGGTWERFAALLRKAGYHQSGLPKIEVARAMAVEMVPELNTSHSFGVLRSTLLEAVQRTE
jgi:Domain of unknown function (DUF4276)